MIKLLKSILSPKNTKSYSDKAEGYPEYLEKSKLINKDINDYLDEDMGWIKPLPVLKEVLFPYIDKFDKINLVELGPGTGRWTRHILNHLGAKKNEYVLVDHSNWMINFLSDYFRKENSLKIVKNDGTSLPLGSNQFDIIFSQGVFIELKPSFIYLYSLEMYRTLNPGGYCIFDYFNFDNVEGWKYFIEESHKGNIYYTFYSNEFIDKIFLMAGFDLEKRLTYGKANFVVYAKNK